MKMLAAVAAGGVLSIAGLWVGFCWLLFAAEHEPRRRTTSSPTTPLGVLRAVS